MLTVSNKLLETVFLLVFNLSNKQVVFKCLQKNCNNKKERKNYALKRFCDSRPFKKTNALQ